MTSFRMPAEWEPHDCCWMAWPRQIAEWPVPMEEVYPAFASLVLAIAEFEPVKLLVDPADRHLPSRWLPADIAIFEIPLDDSWMRDIGPTFVCDPDGGIAGIDWQFNGWGKYPHQADKLVASRLLDAIGIARIPADWVNEGGAIHVDGAGTCLLTRTVQLNANRNPDLTAADVEARLAISLGCDQFLWLPEGLIDDDTDGHVDELACFARDNLLLAASTSPSDPNFERLQANLQVLGGLTTRDGRQVQVQHLPLPPPLLSDGRRLSRSYVNFYIANGGILMPRYGEDRSDAIALDIVRSSFPGRRVVQVDCSVLVTGGGNIHCLTQQQPSVRGVRK